MKIIKFSTALEYLSFSQKTSGAFFMISRERDDPFDVIEIKISAYLKLFNIGASGRFTTSYKLDCSLEAYGYEDRRS